MNTPQGNSPHADAVNGLDQALADTLARGHRWLRFPAPLEAAFQADRFNARRLAMAVLAVVGLLGYLSVTRNDARLLPDLQDWLDPLHRVTLWGGTACLVLALWVSRWWRRAWLFDALMAVNTLAVSLIIVWMGASSRADTAITHTTTIIGAILFACIAARLRFYWALGNCTVALLAYAALVHGHTPWQALVAQANLHLLAVVTLFTLLLNYAFEHTERRNWLLRQLQLRQRARLLEDTLRLQRLSTEDPLTGLPNRRQFDVDLQRAWARAQASGQPLSLVLLDVDHFKAYNDSHGHPEGDACLRQIAIVLADWAQVHQGQVARLGGEEFALLLPQLRGAAAATVAQGLCEAVAALQRPHHASPVADHVTISLGVAEARPQRDSLPQALFKAADVALYQAKDSGRNRVCLTPPSVLRMPSSEIHATPLEWPPLAPDPEAMPVSDEVRHLQSLLKKGLWRLRFPRVLEQAYLDHQSAERRVYVRGSAMVGLFMFIAYLFGNTASFPDVPAQLMWFLPALGGLMALAVLLTTSQRFSAWQREASYSLGICVMSVATAWVISHSQATTVWSFVVAFALVPLFAGAAARLTFRFAVPPSLISVAAVAGFFEPDTELARMIFDDSLTTMINAALYPLVAAYALDHAMRKEWLLGRIAEHQHEALQRLGAQLQQLSLTDALTGLPNRRQFEESFVHLHHAAVRDGQSLAVMVIDVDHFKRYNDGHGHPAGDDCLRQIAQGLQRVAQAGQGQVARLGGEEFGLMMQTEPARARRMAELACAIVRDLHIAHGHAEAGPHVTISVGLYSEVPEPGHTLLHYLAQADAALYRAKSGGRNRVVSIDHESANAPETSHA